MAWNFQRLHKETFKVKSCKKWIPLWRWAKGFTKSFNGAIFRKTLKRLLMWKAVLLEHIFCYLLFKNSPYSNFDGKAQITVRQLTKHLLQLKIDTINNINVRTFGAKVYTWIYQVQIFWVKVLWMQLKNFEKPKDVQISRITVLLSLNILLELSLPHQVEEATHLWPLVFLRI